MCVGGVGGVVCGWVLGFVAASNDKMALYIKLHCRIHRRGTSYGSLMPANYSSDSLIENRKQTYVYNLILSDIKKE